ncbi:MAG: WGR domain-containing protein [Deltaproteobacteria bacterium]|nr:WGR domain-containing protein [Deltaproteobacteria bacterium]
MTRISKGPSAAAATGRTQAAIPKVSLTKAGAGDGFAKTTAKAQLVAPKAPAGEGTVAVRAALAAEPKKSLEGIAPKVMLTFEAGSSRKFYELEVQSTDLLIRFGRLGTDGQTQTRSFDSELDAVKAYGKKLAEKEKEGYTRQLAAPAPSEVTSETPKMAGLADWKKLSADDRQDILDRMEYEAKAFPFVASTNEVAIDTLKGEAKAFAESMRASMEENCYMELDNEEHVIIGEPKVTVEIFTHVETKEILGGSIRFFQKGGDNEDFTYGHFDSVAEAKAAGVDVEADVSWSASGLFDHDGAALKTDDHMEWGGY